MVRIMGTGKGFRVATYNIWGAGLPWRYRHERSVLRGAVEGSPALDLEDEALVWERRRDGLVRALGSAAPDLVALQEVVRSPAADRSRAHELADRLGLSSVVLSVPGPFGGLALLSRRPVLSSAELPLRSMTGAFGGHPTVLEVVVDIARLYVVHVPVGPEAIRAACVAEIGELAAAAPADRPLVLCGDFNCPADGAPMKDLVADGRLTDSWIEAGGAPEALTMPMPDPTWRLDHVLHRPADGLGARPRPWLLGAEPDEGGLYPSDHSGVAVEFA